MASKKYRKVTLEEAKKLEAMGVKLETIYENKCILCGKKFTAKTEEQINKKLEKHVKKKCLVAKWIRGATKILEIAGLKNVVNGDLLYLQDGKFPEGCERTKPEELEILDNIKDMLDNWGKKGTENE